MGFANRAIVAAGLGFAVSALVGCGGSGSLLSSGQANGLSAQLEQASEYLDNGQCQDAQSQIASFRSSVDGLNSVNSTLIGNLDQGATTIAQLAQRDCPVDDQTHTTKTTKTTDTVSTPTVITNTNTTPTTPTTPTVTMPTVTMPTTTIITVTTPTTPTTTTGTTPTTTTGTTPTTGGSGFGTTTTTGTTTNPVGDGGQGAG
jgi:hypothetical protein